MSNLNLVEASVTVAGSKVEFSKFTLHQKMNDHHRCEILVDFDAFGDKTWMADPIKHINFIGEPLSITMTHKQTGESSVFSGLVSDVSFSGYHGAHNHIIIHGVSETIKLAGKPHMDSFVNKTLEDIVTEAVGTSGSGAAIKVKPEFKKPLIFQMQYNESCFDFLNRLSYLYGESFYSKDGSDVFFGKPQLDDAVDIKYDVEMTFFNLKASLQPPRFQHHNYIQERHEEKLEKTRKDVPDAAGYLQPALDKSEKIYTSNVNSPVGALVHDKDSLLKMVDIERTKAVADMLILSGTTQTSKVGLGKVVTVSFPGNLNISTSPGAFVVTEVTHQVDLDGNYSNTFSGVRAALGYIPVDEPKLPVAAPMRATVVSNADPDGAGRIQVQMQFQKYSNKQTNWIRVQSPDAGSSAVFPKDRGYIFIPEEGDEVMVQFEENDPARPYCAGSLYPEIASRGGKENNNLKTIQTRSGHIIKFNDSEGNKSITITDIAENVIFLDTVGSQIKINAPKKISITSEDIEISASKSLMLSSGKETQQTVGSEFNQTVGTSHTLAIGDSMNVKIDKQMKLQTTTGNVDVQAGNEIHESAKGNVIITSEKKTDVISQSDITLQSGKNVYIAK